MCRVHWELYICDLFMCFSKFIFSIIGSDECLLAGRFGSCNDVQQCKNTNNVFECTCLDGYIYDSTNPDTCTGKK